MTYFKLDIPKVNESISKYNNIKKECLEDLNIVYRGLEYTESGWNDFNSSIFMKKVKKDKYKINEYFLYLDSLYNEIKKFKTAIDIICSREGYRRNSITLKFDDSDIKECKRYLNNAVILLNESLNKINISDFDINFKHIDLVYDLRNEIKILKNSINELIKDVDNFVSNINTELKDSKFRMKRIGVYNFNLVKTNYKWTIVDLDLK